MNSTPFSRRGWLRSMGNIIGTAALTGSAAAAANRNNNLLEPRPPVHAARARNVIFLYMHGGVSHVDTFDYRPELTRQHGKALPDSHRISRTQFAKNMGTLMGSPWRFRQHGDSGAWVSELFPHLATVSDELCFIKSMYGESTAHAPAMQKLHTGFQPLIRPSLGSWVSFGLGSENTNLPAFVSICPPASDAGGHTCGSAFLPAACQGTTLGSAGMGAARAQFENIENPLLTAAEQQRLLKLINAGNLEQLNRMGPDQTLESRSAMFDLAWRMQAHAPEARDISKETEDTQKLYGLDNIATEPYGHGLLLARRFVERGVRFVQVAHTGVTGTRWDQHFDIARGHAQSAESVDKPIAGLLHDLRQRGLLDETLVVWCTEFGRTPEAQNGSGRGHHAHGYTYWLAGGGIKAGTTHGATDDFGCHAVENPVHIHDLHATILHLLGLNHSDLTFHHSGRDFRLTDTGGRVLHDIIA